MLKNKVLKRIISSITAFVVFVGIVLPIIPMYVKADSTEFYQQSFKLYPDDNDSTKTISLNGLMPKGSSAEAVDVTREYSEDDKIADESSSESVVAAYDITITKGKKEYQPGEGNPVYVEIKDPAIAKDSTITLWHIKDNGEKEEVTSFIVTDGKIGFYATGFSAYVIVEDSGIKPFVPKKELASQLGDLTGDRSSDGFFMFYGSERFASSALNSNNCLIEETDMLNAAKWYFEPDGNYYKIYTFINGVKKYIHTKNGNEIELSTSADLFEVEKEKKQGSDDEYESWVTLKNKDGKRYLQHSNGGGGIRYYTNKDNTTNSRFSFYFADVATMPDDPYGLNNKTYGIMDYEGGAVGNALMASDSQNYQRLDKVTSRDKDDPSVITPIYISQDSDATMWTIVNAGDNNYKLKATVDETEKYLKASGDSLELTADNSEATAFALKPTTTNDGAFTLSAADKYISFSSSNGFTLTTTANPLRFAKKTTVKDTDSITYTASRISISDGEKACNGKEVIVYTRIWDDVNKRYDFYAIDHDGSLKPCYASGDKLMWLDDATNSLMWKFTVYTDSDGEETGYYELQNTYSGKFIAPQLTGGQILADEKIGIQIPGRKYEYAGDNKYNYGEYYSSIVAWDKRYYDYAALKGVVDKKTEISSLTSVAFSQAASFYFATLDSVDQTEISNTLHEVETIDNQDYGITLKTINFETQPGYSAASGSTVTWDYFGNESTDKKGLLSSSLNDAGHPTVKYSKDASQIGKDFGSAFSTATDANHLFIKSIHESSGYFEFDSCQNFATLLKKDGTVGNEFRVYKELGTTDETSKTTLKHGQFFPYNDLTLGKYSTKNLENLYNVNADFSNPTKGKLSDDDPRKYEKLYLIQNPDYYLGMEMDAKFVQTPNGLDAWGHDVIFEFTGDDDFWLYVDGELIIDLGGIHSAQDGKVNFRTGEVIVQGKATTLRDLFISHYVESGMSQDDAKAKANTIFEPKTVEITKNDGTTENVTCYVFKDYTEHSMKVYYMERGAGASNLHMRFNLSSVTPGNVLFAKKLSGNENDLADMDYSIIQYPFQIKYKLNENDQDWIILKNEVDAKNKPTVSYQNSTQSVRYEESYTPPGSLKAYDHVFFLTPNKNIEINFPDEAMYYQIVECAVNTDNYDDVKVNGESALESGVNVPSVTGNLKDLISASAQVSELPTITFDNGIKEGNIRTLNITKKLYNEDYSQTGKIQGNELYYESDDKSKEDKTTFNIRLYLSNGTGNELSLADMCRYYVVDPTGHLCQWNADSQIFESTQTLAKNVASLTDEQKQNITFHTSRYGSISNIPAGYTIRVPGLPAGTKFMVEERDYEIPTGYDLIDYDCKSDSSGTGTYLPDKIYILNSKTYTIDENSSLYNSAGTIRAGYDAEMLLNNRRGIGLEVEKKWSDADFTKSHSPIYTAVYIDGELLEGSIRMITSDETSVRYFFDKLQSGKSLSDYEIREIEVTDPIVDINNKVTSYSSVSVLAENSMTDVDVVSLDNTASTQSYTVKYQKGEPEKTAEALEENNVRSDVISNIRKGGIMIDLHKWNNSSESDEPLEGGTFTLHCDGEIVGTYISDETGNVTVLYDFREDKEYVLTQTISPRGYTGLSEPIRFTITHNDGVYSIKTLLNDNDSDNDTDTTDGKNWCEYKNAPGNGIAAKIDLYNKPFELKAVKTDRSGNILVNGAKFSLHRTITVYGNKIKDFNAMPGYDELESGSSGEDGLVPKINNSLTPGSYYLSENEAPTDYEKFDDDVMFTISQLGVVTVSDQQSSLLTVTRFDDKDEYVIKIPNTKIGASTAELTINKTVEGSLGNRSKEFTFTLEVDGSADADEFEWTKNGTVQTEKLKSGATFLMRHDDTVVMTLPTGAGVTISENSENYTSSFKLGNDDAEQTSSKQFVIDADTVLNIVNTLDGALPTGIGLNDELTVMMFSSVVCAWILLNRAHKKELKNNFGEQ